MGQDLMRRPRDIATASSTATARRVRTSVAPALQKGALPGLPWSPGSWRAYEQALAGQPTQIGTERHHSGTLRHWPQLFRQTSLRADTPSKQ